ncbi:MAG: primase-like DNA-binding domain-containing protein [Acetobacterium sp.]|nr:primase-like DNA-binding domain-containing protein [Acetobacterium sp.]
MNSAELKILESLQDEARKKREDEIIKKIEALEAGEPHKTSNSGDELDNIVPIDDINIIPESEPEIQGEKPGPLKKEIKLPLFFLVPKRADQPDGAKKVDVSLLAIYMKRKFSLKVYNGQFRVFKTNYYQHVNNIKHLISAQIPESYRIAKNIEDCEKLLLYDGALTLKDEDLAPEKFIAFKNGILDVETFDFMEYKNEKAKNLAFIHQIGHNWNPMIANDQKTDDFFNTITDENQEAINYLYQALGVLMSNYRDFKHVFYFTGKKDTGKSQYLHVCEILLTNSDGARDYSSIGLSVFTDEKSKELTDIVGKRANICAETPPLNIKNDTLLKQLSGGDFVTLFQKFLGSITFKNKAMLVFAGNTVPNFFVSDKSSIGERLLIYEFKTVIPRDKQIPKVYLTLNMEYIIVKAVEQLVKFIDNRQHFTIPEEIHANRELMERESDSIYRFYKDCVVYTDNKDHRINSHDLFTAYQYFLMDDGVIPKDPYSMKPDVHHVKISQRAFIGKIKPMIGEAYHSRSILYFDGKIENCFTGIQLQGVNLDWNDQEYKIKLLKRAESA